MSVDTLQNIAMYAARIIAFLTAIPFHEAAHAFVSDKLGDPTARSLGRLSLNPLRHLDPWGFLAMLLIGIGWAKPVPVNTQYYKNRKLGMAVSSAAGPLSNIVLAYFTMVLCKLFTFGYVSITNAYPLWVFFVSEVLLMLAYINVILAVFNLIPIPPFDGSRIFLAFLPEKLYFGAMRYERYIMLVVIALFWFGNFSGYLNVVNVAVLRGMNWATGYLDSIFGLALM